MCVLSCYSCVQLFVTLWTIAHQAPLSMGFSRQEYWSGLPCPPPGDILDPGIKPGSPLASLPLSHRGSPWSSFSTVRYLPSSVQSLNHVWLLATQWTAACQASLSITSFWSLLKLMAIESVMPSYYLFLCCSFLLLPSIFPSISIFFSESVLHIRWPKY